MHIHIHVCMLQQLMKNEAMCFKEIIEVYMGEFGGKKGKGNIVNYNLGK